MFGKTLHTATVLSSVALIACGGSSTTADKTPTETTNGSAAESSAANNATTTGGDFALPGAGATAVSSVYYSPNRMLYVGYADGRMASVDVNGRRGSVDKLTNDPQPVSAISNDGQFAVIGANPPIVIKKDGGVVLQMNNVKQFESARFGADGTTLYVADPGGKIRIWGQAHSFEESGDTEKMEQYLNRQAPDFHVEFSGVTGPFVFNEKNTMFVGDQAGTIMMWDPLAPSSIKKIMKLTGGVKSIDATDRNVVVTSKTGQLKVGVLDPPSYLRWSKDAKADFAAVNTFLTDTFVSLTGGKISVRQIEDGSAQWEKDLGGTTACGLDVSPDGRQVVACVDNNIVVLDASTGNIDSFFSVDGELKWQTASGESIK